MRSSLEMSVFSIPLVAAVLAGCDAGPVLTSDPQADPPDASIISADWSSLEERPCPSDSTLTYENFGEPFLLAWCNGCHSAPLPEESRLGAPLGIDFDTLGSVRALAPRMWTRAGDHNRTMPPTGGPPDRAREDFGEWLACGAPASRTSRPDGGVAPPPDGGQVSPDGGPVPPDGGQPPPRFSDAGTYASPVTPNAAFCGPMTCDPGAGAFCCIQPSVGLECTEDDTRECAISIGCDGPEDCPGASCCIQPLEDGLRISCESACVDTITACHRAIDCSDSMPICCRGSDVPFGRCTTAAMAAPGEQCDVR